MSQKQIHLPVLLTAALDALSIRSAGIYIDATFGRGGHSQAILSRLGGQGRLLTIDKDESAIQVAKEKFAADKRITAIHASFARLQATAKSENIMGKVDGILFDLGVSSPQLDDASRGFSFMHSGPLDMRMNQQQELTAATWLAQASESEIAQILYRYGEEKFSRRIAKAIVNARQAQAIITTSQLAEIIKRAHPKWERHKHPATRSFQAIRIFINAELIELKQALLQCLDVLKTGGRLVVISFHSLEDRLVKQFIKQQQFGQPLPRHLPIEKKSQLPGLVSINKKVKPSSEEIAVNIRSRSAILRVAEKVS